MNIFVGNLSYRTTEEELRKAFESFGQVANVNIIRDRFSGQSRGFGFIEMPEEGEGEAAINGLNGTEVDGRSLNVNVARQRDEGRREPRRD